ncbi:ribonucleotide-diphosphate reductase subunit beta [Leifsonia shinshuensis]
MSQRVQTTDVEQIDGYEVPIDPMEVLGCDSCQ